MQVAADPSVGSQNERASVLRLLRVLATAGAGLMLVVIVASASLRLSQAGLSCADWPSCYGHVEAQGPLSTNMQIARIAHRVAASSVGIVLLAALLIGAAQRPRPARQVALAGAALAVALLLAAIGASFSASSTELPSPAVMLANLTGGFALLALLWWLRLSTLPGKPSSERSPTWLLIIAALALAAAIVEVLLGGLVSAKFAALACPVFPGCGAEWPAGALLQSINPFAERVTSPDGMILRTHALAALHWTHRVGALAVTMFAATLAIAMLSAGRRVRRVAIILAALLALQLALGAAMIETRFPLALALAHNLCAALLLTALISTNRALYFDTTSREHRTEG